MPEVISLLSSSPSASPAKSATRPEPCLPASTGIELGSDDFNETGDIDYPINQPSKKRKLSHDSAVSKIGGLIRVTENADAAFDLSSDIELPIAASPRRRKGLNGDGNSSRADEIDDIVFSSSAPARTATKSQKPLTSANAFDLSSDSLPDDPFEGLFSASQPASGDAARSGFSVKTASLLAGLSETTSAKPTIKPAKGRSTGLHATSSRTARERSDVSDDIVVSSPPKATARKKKSASVNNSTKQSDAAANKAQKAADREAEKERKQAEKAQKAREKQKAADLAEVNKSKTDKKTAVLEMIVEVSGDLQDTSVGNQVEEYLNQAGVTMSYVEEEVNLENASLRFQDLGSPIRWKRQSKRDYDEEAGHYLQTEFHMKREQHVIVYLKATEFAMVASGCSGEDNPTLPTEAAMKENFDLHVATLRSRYKDCIPVYLIEGMYAWLKKNHNARNREYTAAVRAQQPIQEVAEGAASSQPKVRKRRKPEAVDLSFITEDIAEDFLLHLQVAHQPILIQHTTSASMTAAQIFTFTQQLSLRPGKLIELNQNLKAASFCMAIGQVKTGDDARDTYIKMLQEVQRVTPAMAYGIESSYPSVRKLVEGFREHGNVMLEDVRKSANKDGAWSDRRLGPMVSKRLYKVFMGRDPAAMDGMS